jgi:hypothetical protein
MIDKDKWLMMAEDDGGGGGGGGEESRGTAVFEEAAGSPESVGAPESVEAKPEAAPMVDARHLAHEFGNVLGQHFKAPPKEVTVEEAKRMLNVWEPTPEWIAKYDNIETRNQALAEQRDGLIRQADTIMQYRMREMMGQMQERYGPVVEYMQQNEARAGEYRFAQSYPQLAAPGLRPVLFAVSQNLLQQGVQFRSEREMFEAIARGVEAVVKVNKPDFTLGNGGRPPTRGGGIPVTTPGAGGGSDAGGSGASVRKPRGLAIWD